MTDTVVEHADAETKLPPQVRNALLALIVGGIAAILDSTMVTLAIHTLVVKLHSSDGRIQWVTTGFLLAMAVAIPISGWAESRWGGKRVWMAALVLFVLASVLCAVSWNDGSLIGFRFLQGFAAGLIFPLMQTLAVRAAGGHISSRLMAAVSLPIALGPILGPVIGGVILNWLSWRWLFLVNVPVIAAGLLLAWRFLPADRHDRTAVRARLDMIGLVLLAPALGGILLGLSQLSEDGGIGHVGVLEPLLAGVALLAAFIVWASRPGERQPIVDIRLLRLRSLGSASAVLFTAGAAVYAAMFLLPLYYQQLRGESVLHAGLLIDPARLRRARLSLRGRQAGRAAGSAYRDDLKLPARRHRDHPVRACRAEHKLVVAGRPATGPRSGDRGGADPADVRRLPGHPTDRHPARHHEHPHRPEGRRIVRHRDRRGRPPNPSSPTALPVLSRARSGGRSASRSPRSSPPSPSPPAGSLERADVQPMPPGQGDHIATKPAHPTMSEKPTIQGTGHRPRPRRCSARPATSGCQGVWEGRISDFRVGDGDPSALPCDDRWVRTLESRGDLASCAAADNAKTMDPLAALPASPMGPPSAPTALLPEKFGGQFGGQSTFVPRPRALQAGITSLSPGICQRRACRRFRTRPARSFA